MRRRFDKLCQLFSTPNGNSLLAKRRSLRVEPLESRWLLSIGTLHVDADSVAPAPDGLAWETAYPALQDAIDRAAVLNTDAPPENDISQIWIAEGTYKPTTPLNAGDPRSATFSMLDAVSLYGGFFGDEPDIDSRHGDETILSADLDADGERSDGDAYHVVYVDNVTGVTLDALTITGGNGSSYGGGIHSTGTLSITNSKISGNASSNNGGGIHSTGTLSITNSRILDNRAYYGGGIHNSGTLTVTGSTISDNNAGSYGGGIQNGSFGSLKLTGSTISGNFAGTRGGGIYGMATVTVIASTISDNVVAMAGGGIFSKGTTTVTDSTISANEAQYSGGEGGGGICNHPLGTLTVTNSTISGNSTYYGGGIRNYGTLTAHNTIVADNMASHQGPDVRGTLAGASSHNLIGDGSDMSGIDDGVNGNLVGTALHPIDPRFVRLPSEEDPDGDLQLLAGSPAIDVGDDDRATEPTDLSGNPRIIGEHVDMGAYEAPFTFFWDEDGPGDWNAEDLNGYSRWLDRAGNRLTDFPDDDYEGALIRGDSVTMPSDRQVYRLTVDNGQVSVDGSATLTLAGGGGLHVRDVSQASSPITGEGSVTLQPGSTLTLEAADFLGDLSQREWGDYTRTIISVTGGINGTFDHMPDEDEHLGYGVFLSEQDTKSVDLVVDLFQAAPGDVDGDRDVDISDIMDILAAGKFGDGPSDATWLEGNFDGDLDVDISDIMMVLATGLFDDGPYVGVKADGDGAGDLVAELANLRMRNQLLRTVADAKHVGSDGVPPSVLNLPSALNPGGITLPKEGGTTSQPTA